MTQKGLICCKTKQNNQPTNQPTNQSNTTRVHKESLGWWTSVLMRFALSILSMCNIISSMCTCALYFLFMGRRVSRLVVFYGISTLVGYLMPNPVYTCISNIYDLQKNSL